jgi:glutaredoxin-related protein
LNTRLKSLMNQSKVVLFMKGSPEAPRCGFSRKICGILKDQNVEFKHFDILTDESVRQGECCFKLFSFPHTDHSKQD